MSLLHRKKTNKKKHLLHYIRFWSVCIFVASYETPMVFKNNDVKPKETCPIFQWLHNCEWDLRATEQFLEPFLVVVFFAFFVTVWKRAAWTNCEVSPFVLHKRKTVKCVLNNTAAVKILQIFDVLSCFIQKLAWGLQCVNSNLLFSIIDEYTKHCLWAEPFTRFALRNSCFGYTVSSRPSHRWARSGVHIDHRTHRCGVVIVTAWPLAPWRWSCVCLCWKASTFLSSGYGRNGSSPSDHQSTGTTHKTVIYCIANKDKSPNHIIPPHHKIGCEMRIQTRWIHTK